MAKKLTTSKGNQSVARATTTAKSTPTTTAKTVSTGAAKSTPTKTVASSGASKSTPVKTVASSGASKSTVNNYTPTTKSYTGGGNTKSTINNVANLGTKDTLYGGQQKSTVNNVDDTLNQIKAEAQRQAEANKTYVQNLLNQLQNSRPVQNAVDFLRGSGNPNLSPEQRTNEMLDTVKNRTIDTGFYGAGAGTGVNPAYNLVRASMNTSNGSTPNAMQGDRRYQAPTTETPSLDEVLAGYTNRQSVNPAMQTILGDLGYNAGSGNTRAPYSNEFLEMEQMSPLRKAANDSITKSMVETIDNPNPNAPYMEVPNFAMGYPVATGLNADGTPEYTSIVKKDRLANDLLTNLENLASGNNLTGDPSKDVARPYSNPNYPFDTSLSGGDSNFASRMKGDGDISAYINGGDGGDGGNGGYGRRGRNGSNGTNGTGLTGLEGDGYLDISALYDLLEQRLGEYDANFNEMMQALLDSYNMNFGSLEDAYLEALNRLGLNYSDTEALLNGNLDTSRQALEDDRTRALQEAYISRMMQEKSLADQLDAYGLSGGATESVMADLRNNYANNRASVEDKVQQSLRDLLQAYMQNLSDARANYNNQLLDAEQSRLSAAQNLANNFQSAQNDVINQRSNARAGAYEDLYNTLANLTMKGINYVS
jgi:hypothetical protein